MRLALSVSVVIISLSAVSWSKTNSLLRFPKNSVLVAQNSSTLTASGASPANSLSVKAPAVEEEFQTKYKGTAVVHFLGRSLTDEYVKANAGWMFISTGLEVEYTSWLSMNVGVAFMLGEGAGQNYYTDEGSTTNAVGIDELSVNLKPFKFSTLKFGALDARLNPLVSVMTPNTYVGAAQKFEFANEKETAKLMFQLNEQMPGEGVKTGGVVDQQKNPFFLAATMQTDLKAEPISTTFKLAATRFQFGNLSNGTAKSSLMKGNSPLSFTGQGDATQFLIGFSGTESAAAVETELTNNITTTLKGGIIKNDRAPDDRNQGQVGTVSVKFKKGNLAYIPSYTAFNVQADVTPAAYTISANRYHNRKGQKMEMKVELEKQKLSFYGNYTKADELVENPYLADREIYNLGVEAKYDLF